jgi:hypothetical protein
MSGWARFLGLKDKVRPLPDTVGMHSLSPSCFQILALSDTDAAWSKELGLDADLTARGMGIRTARYALIIDDLTVKYVGVSILSSTFLDMALILLGSWSPIPVSLRLVPTPSSPLSQSDFVLNDSKSLKVDASKPVIYSRPSS